MSRPESRRSFFVALMSRAAGLYVVATGGAATLLAACVAKYGGPPEPATVPVPEPIAAKYGGPDMPPSPAPTSTAPAPVASTSATTAPQPPTPSPTAVPKYGGPPMPAPVAKYGGPPMRPKYGGPGTGSGL